MSVAYTFAPLSSMMRAEDRLRYRHLDLVQARFARAEEVLRERRGIEVCLDQLLDQSTSDLCDRSGINYTAAAIIAMQLGVVDRLAKFLPKPDWVVGCSLGDVARTICAGAGDFETALIIATMSLDELERAESIGGNVIVITTPRRPFSPGDLAWMDGLDLAVSRLSDRVLNVAGRRADLQTLREQSHAHRWKVLPLLDFPLHSRHAACYMQQASELLSQAEFSAPEPEIRVYSSVLGREIRRPEEFRDEFVASLVQPHDWQDSVNDLVENHGVTSFVNIGPCRTLARLLQESGRDVWEADDLIEQELVGSLTPG